MKNKAIKNAIKKMFGVGITTDYFNAIAKQRLPANNALYDSSRTLRSMARLLCRFC